MTVALGVQGCAGSSGGGDVSAGAARLAPEFQPVPNTAFEAWVTRFKARATSGGISAPVVERAFARAGYLPGVVERDRNQSEFKRSFEDYLSLTASESKVLQGREMYRKYGATLKAIEGRYGVPAKIVAAIWGVESSFGSRRGDIPTISALATLAFDGRRGAFFEKQLMSALRILQSGDTTVENLRGSWAGAMGHTQFIPTSYEAFAVDFNGDGRRDIWSDDPTDALASAAAYLSRNGWKRGLTWGGESPSGSLQPDPGGPRFATTHNFKVIKRYNNSDSYALAVGYLADRIAGAGPLKVSFGADRYGLTKADRVRLQEALAREGFAVGKADGVLGSKTFAAIEAYERQNGLPVTGKPSQLLMQRLGIS